MSVPPRHSERRPAADREVSGEHPTDSTGSRRSGRTGLIAVAVVLVVLLAAIVLLYTS
jgi:hypothetical protein